MGVGRQSAAYPDAPPRASGASDRVCVCTARQVCVSGQVCAARQRLKRLASESQREAAIWRALSAVGCELEPTVWSVSARRVTLR